MLFNRTEVNCVRTTEVRTVKLDLLSTTDTKSTVLTYNQKSSVRYDVGRHIGMYTFPEKKQFIFVVPGRLDYVTIIEDRGQDQKPEKVVLYNKRPVESTKTVILKDLSRRGF